MTKGLMLFLRMLKNETPSIEKTKKLMVKVGVCESIAMTAFLLDYLTDFMGDKAITTNLGYYMGTAGLVSFATIAAFFSVVIVERVPRFGHKLATLNCVFSILGLICYNVFLVSYYLAYFNELNMLHSSMPLIGIALLQFIFLVPLLCFGYGAIYFSRAVLSSK